MIKAVVFDAYGTLYDIQSVTGATEEAFPGYGDLITQVWRIKQLEYTWQRTAMERYEDFAVVTRESLAYSLKLLGLTSKPSTFERIMDKYIHLTLYPDAMAALAALKDRKLAILSNGSPDMLNALVKNTGLDGVLDAILSVDSAHAFKPSPKAYALVEQNIGVKPDEVLFISSNPFDVCGARAFGFKVAWIERVTSESLMAEYKPKHPVTPLFMFKALRTQMDPLGFEPDYRIRTLADLPALVASTRISS